MEQFVINIGRQLGSGGRTVGEIIARRLGVKLYDKELINLAARESGICPATRVEVQDTTGAGDAFFAGATIGLTYGKTLGQSCAIGSRLAASVICTSSNVCPRFLPEEFGLDVAVTE